MSTPGVQLHQAVLTPYQHHLSRQRFDRGIKITFRVVEHRLAFLHGAGAGAATAGAAVLPTVTGAGAEEPNSGPTNTLELEFVFTFSFSKPSVM